MRKLVAGMLTLLFVASCYRNTFFTTAATPAAMATYSRWHHFLIFGLAPLSDNVDIKQVCPSGLARAESSMSFVNGLVAVLTAGIYTPMTVEVWCAQGGQASAPPRKVAVTVAPTPEMVEGWRRDYPDLEELAREQLRRGALAQSGPAAASIR